MCEAGNRRGAALTAQCRRRKADIQRTLGTLFGFGMPTYLLFLVNPVCFLPSKEKFKRVYLHQQPEKEEIALFHTLATHCKMFASHPHHVKVS